MAVDIDMMSGECGRYLAMAEHDNVVAVRVLSCEDPAGDVYGETKSCTADWRGTAALVILAWEHAVDVLYAVADPDRDVAWHVARSQPLYSGLTNEFYHDGTGWCVVVFKALGQT